MSYVGMSSNRKNQSVIKIIALIKCRHLDTWLYDVYGLFILIIFWEFDYLQNFNEKNRNLYKDL